MDETLNASSTAAMIATLSLSFGAIVIVFFRRAGGEPLLRYEPRHRVPWGVFAISIPLYCVIEAFLRVFVVETTNEIDVQPENFVFRGFVYAFIMVGFVIVAMPWLKLVCGATTRDLGLPLNLQELGRDIGIGIFTFLASLLPVYAIQFSLTQIYQPDQDHPLIEQILEHKSPQLLLVGAMMAVIAAPIFEEFTFRLLLQGWLERREDELMGIAETERPTPAVIESRGEAVEPLEPNVLLDSPLSGTINSTEVPLAETTEGMLFGLPHGWAPVLISGVAFGLAHIGHGIAPIPLVLFGIILGYLYQRTHRLTPCITAHACFNAYSMLILWLQIG